MREPRPETPQAMGARHLRESGYAKGGGVHPDAAQDEALVRRMVKPAALQKRAKGGPIEGDKPRSRPDRRGRGPKTVNIIIGRGDSADKEQQAAQQGMRTGMAMAGQAAAAPHPPMPPPMAPHPPMGPPAMGGAGGPGGAPPVAPRPGMPPQMAAHGGTIKVRAHERRRSGGAV